MSDAYQDDTEEGAVHPADPPQQLVDLVSNFNDPQAQGAMRDAAVQVQDYLVRRQMADDNAAASDRLVNNLGSFKDGLASLAAQDPAAVELGLNVAPDLIDAFVGVNPFLPEDKKPAIRDSLVSDVQREVVRSGVMSAANRDEAQARRLLERHDDVLGDSDRTALNGYVSAMANARSLDSAAASQQVAVDNTKLVNHSTVNYLTALVDPATGETQFPSNWAQRVTADQSIPPGHTAVMLDTFNRVRENGDGETDWHTFADMTNRIANGQPVPLGDVFAQVGQGLKMADAVTIARGSVDSTAPPAQREFRQLDATIQAARQVLAPPEYGLAGDRAFERFMSWLVPQYRNAGPGSLNPAADGYILPKGDGSAGFWNSFAPQLSDFVTGSAPGVTAGASRPPLESIFRRG